jgi:Poxvirus Late Transcription Factor VLTF3 like
MFKDKTSKKRIYNNKKDISTLDAMHTNIINEYSLKKIEEREYLSKINELENIFNSNINIINQCENKNDLNINNLWSSNIRIKEEIIKIKEQLKKINNFNEIEYYENTSYILFNYYDIIEEQSKQRDKIIPKKMTKFKNKSIIESFNLSLNNNNNNDNDNNDDEEEEKIIEKSSLVDEYLAITNKYHIKKLDYDNRELCKKCHNSLLCLQHDAIMICNHCGYQEPLLVEQNRPILKQNTKDTSHFSYKRINHFREWCNQVQGKESTDIPNEIFEKILNEIKKEKIIDTKTITYNKMREILKRLRINKYYEHINYIINRINGIPTPQFSPELEDKLCNMFRDIQAPFLKHCPKDRKNFLSYSYVLYKFFQILGLNEYLKFFPLLKSREKLYAQDQIWKKICEELNYMVIPSL